MYLSQRKKSHLQLQNKTTIMAKLLLAGFIVAAFVGSHLLCRAQPGPDLKLKVQELFLALEELQVKSDRPYVAPGLWKEDAGLYPSDVRLNFVGRPEVAELRHLVAVFDNNMFATAWITITLLEANLYGNIPRPSDEQLRLAIDAIGQYHDRNRNYSNSLMNFWPQAYNSSTSTWVSTPYNLLESYDFMVRLPWDKIDEILDRLGWQDVEKFVKEIIKDRNGYLKVFKIPPDFDDTFVNLGLGALLTDLAHDFPDALTRWRRDNTNVTSALEALRRYAYRPFGLNPDLASIDPRTYYYLRYFLNYARANGRDVALVPTWVQSIEEARQMLDRGVVMPLQVNNVDMTVAANTVYGLTGAILSGLLPFSVLDDPDLRQVYHNTTTFIIYMMEHSFVGRPDLALTYYPSVFEFYWFVARTYNRMETARRTKPLPAVMEELFPSLKSVLEGPITAEVLQKSQALGEDMIYFDDFLGDGDVNENNVTEVKAEDRLFTTVMAGNVLLTTWTLFNDSDRTVRWKSTTPADVRTAVEKIVRFLSHYILDLTYKPWNAFFSASVKGKTSIASYYPTNCVVLLNGTRSYVVDQKLNDTLAYTMIGYVSEMQYDIMINDTGRTPTEFVSYNDPSGFFPFWSSPPYTYAVAMSLLARYDKLESDRDLTNASQD